MELRRGIDRVRNHANLCKAMSTEQVELLYADAKRVEKGENLIATDTYPAEATRSRSERAKQSQSDAVIDSELKVEPVRLGELAHGRRKTSLAAALVSEKTPAVPQQRCQRTKGQNIKIEIDADVEIEMFDVGKPESYGLRKRNCVKTTAFLDKYLPSVGSTAGNQKKGKCTECHACFQRGIGRLIRHVKSCTGMDQQQRQKVKDDAINFTSQLELPSKIPSNDFNEFPVVVPKEIIESETTNSVNKKRKNRPHKMMKLDFRAIPLDDLKLYMRPDNRTPNDGKETCLACGHRLRKCLEMLLSHKIGGRCTGASKNELAYFNSCNWSGKSTIGTQKIAPVLSREAEIGISALSTEPAPSSFDIYEFVERYEAIEDRCKAECKVCGTELVRRAASILKHKLSGKCTGMSREETARVKELSSKKRPISTPAITNPDEESTSGDLKALPGTVLIPACHSSQEVCKACNGISTASDHENWNTKWFGCVSCGEAYHRSCVIKDLVNPLFAVEPLFGPSNPAALSATPNWKCHACRSCIKCSDTGEIVDTCHICKKSSCSKCYVPKKRPLWTGQWHVCSQCPPKCLSCGDKLGEPRAAESRWCRGCQIDLAAGRACPVCCGTYASDGSGNPDTAVDDGQDDGEAGVDEEDPMIQCDQCSVWVHFPCTGLELKDLKRLSVLAKSCYKCPRCQPIRSKLETESPQCLACSLYGMNREGECLLPVAGGGPTLWTHRSCEPASKQLALTMTTKSVPTHFIRREGARGIGVGVAHVRTWDYSASKKTPVQRTVWTLKRSAAGFTLISTYKAFDATAMDHLLEQWKTHMTKLNAPERLVASLASHFLGAPALWKQIEANPVRPVVKRVKSKHASSDVHIVLDVPPTIPDDGLCARVRCYSRDAPKSSMAFPSKLTRRNNNGSLISLLPDENDDPAYSSVDTFNARFVPVWSEKTKAYRTVTISVAYRQLGGNLIQRGDLIVKRSGIAGYGLFASRKYVPNELVIEYQGEVIGQALADWRESRLPRYKHSCYMFRLDDTRIIDATLVGNAARFINHACQPNCRAKPVIVDGQARILIVAWREIRAGEELSYDYQFALDTEDGKGRLPCYCGSKKCRGWMN